MKLIKNFLSFITAAACCAAISGIMPFSSSAEASATYGDLSYTTVDSDGDGTDDYVEITDCYESGMPPGKHILPSRTKALSNSVPGSHPSKL